MLIYKKISLLYFTDNNASRLKSPKEVKKRAQSRVHNRASRLKPPKRVKQTPIIFS
jgi:hypothetical protein